MTICVAACVHDGVFAADSATSLVERSADGTTTITNVYRHGNKVFNLYKGLPICAMTAGMGHIGMAPIHALAKDFRRLMKNQDSDYCIDRDTYTVEQIAILARKFLFEEKYAALPEPLPAPHALEFWVGGFSAGAETHELWKIQIVNGKCEPPIRLLGNGEAGLWWGGQPAPIQRLLIGYDPVLSEALTVAGVDDDELPQLMSMIRARTEVQLHDAAMPIQDAIELADFLVDTAKRFYRFLPGADTVGGDTDIAVVTRHEQFKWIKRKHFYSAAINPRETDHA
jgi:hypothetical protein